MLYAEAGARLLSANLKATPTRICVSRERREATLLAEDPGIHSTLSLTDPKKYEIRESEQAPK